jgi:hypothetical protein
MPAGIGEGLKRQDRGYWVLRICLTSKGIVIGEVGLFLCGKFHQTI